MISAAEPQWNCHALLQCELRHTAEPHTSLQTWGLYILNNICLSFSSLSFLLCLQENGINKPICMQIINHYLDPLPVYVYKDYNLPGLCIILLGCLWFGFPCVHPDVFHVTRPDQPVCIMHEWLPAGIYVAACDAVTQLTNDQQGNHAHRSARLITRQEGRQRSAKEPDGLMVTIKSEFGATY